MLSSSFSSLAGRREADVDTDVEGISVQDSSEARLIKKYSVPSLWKTTPRSIKQAVTYYYIHACAL